MPSTSYTLRPFKGMWTSPLINIITLVMCACLVGCTGAAQELSSAPSVRSAGVFGSPSQTRNDTLYPYLYVVRSGDPSAAGPDSASRNDTAKPKDNSGSWKIAAIAGSVGLFVIVAFAVIAITVIYIRRRPAASPNYYDSDETLSHHTSSQFSLVTDGNASRRLRESPRPRRLAAPPSPREPSVPKPPSKQVPGVMPLAVAQQFPTYNYNVASMDSGVDIWGTSVLPVCASFSSNHVGPNPYDIQTHPIATDAENFSAVVGAGVATNPAQLEEDIPTLRRQNSRVSFRGEIRLE